MSDDPKPVQAPPCVGCGGVHGGTQVTLNCLESTIARERDTSRRLRLDVALLLAELEPIRAVRARVADTETLRPIHPRAVDAL